LIIGGALGLAYGSFSTKENHETKIGPVELSVKEKETVNIPVGPASARSFWAACCCSAAAGGPERTREPPK
jgi:hypothetical protein